MSENLARKVDELILALRGENPRAEEDSEISPRKRGKGLPARDLTFPEPEPWPKPVDGKAVLDEVEGILRRRVLMENHEYTAVTLWAALSYFIEETHVLPILAILSPVKRCGKTTLLAVLSRLVWRPLAASNITPAAVFRVIEEATPCLLIDEADSFFGGNEELRGILNSGHTRDAAFTIRCVPKGRNHEVRRFSTWGPKAVALIGKLPATLEDRSIVVNLQRKPAGLNLGQVSDKELESLARKLRRFADDHHDLFKAACEDLAPLPLNDRTNDNWRPLRAIALMAGGNWLRLADEAALALSTDEGEDGEARIKLLADLKAIFEQAKKDRLPTAEILEKLHAMEESPWGEWKCGKPLTARQLATLLQPFGIKPKAMRIGGETPRGYYFDDFRNAFERYIYSHTPILSATSATSQLRGRISSATSKASVADGKPHLTCNVADVAHRKGGRVEKGVSSPKNHQLMLEGLSAEANGSVQVLSDKPHRIELRPACRTLVIQAADNILPWEFLFADNTLARLPIGLLARGWRIAFISTGRCWVLPWEEADPEIRPMGSVFTEGQWRELVPQGGAR